MLKERIYLILGINTEIGKTFLVENLCKKIANSRAIKPVISGMTDDDKNSDSAKILAAMNLELNKENLDKISPFRFQMPVSPHFAGKVDYQALINFCQKNIEAAKKNNEFLFIESAGGVMSPITNDKTFLDLARILQIPILLVSSNYLGAISHSLTAIEVLKKYHLLVEKIIVNENFDSLIASEEIAKTIQGFSAIETITINKFFNSLNI